jgi:UDP-GlcNAc:undecaprenyl-phosphate/decaprenyl-phosphate GlcNAc-1-phosphate transferase
MNIPFTLFFVAIISTFIAISILRPFAISINLTDSPDSRKNHEGVVPLIGGLGMFLGFLISVLSSSVDLNQIKFFIMASFIIVIVGSFDDHHDMSVGFRFLFQASAALIVAGVAGVNIESLGGLLSNDEIFLHSWSIFFTVIAIIGGINAVNMSDGIHGLAGSNSLITFSAIAYLAYFGANEQSFTIALLMCAIIPPFLVDNLCIGRSKSKRIFMGDAGSTFLGLGIVWLLIELSQGDSPSFSPVIALWLFAIPLIDTLSTILRRIVIGKSPFKPDLYHLHHIFIRMGFSNNSVLIIIILLSLMMTIIGILGVIYDVQDWKMFLGFVILFLCYFIFSNLLILKINKS